jgi:hypothetical protein
MNDRILVRGEISWWVHFFRVVAAITLVVGIVVLAVGHPAGWAIAAGGAVVWLLLEAVAWQVRSQRAWVTEQADGFLLEDRSGKRTVRDAQLVAAALESKRNLSNGDHKSTTRTLRLWTDDRPDPIVFENAIPVGQADPIAGLTARLLDGLTQRFEEALDRGGSVVGDGWQLTKTGLTLGRPPSETQLPLAEVTAVDLFDNKMCVWRKGKDEACAAWPLSGRNVFLLPALLKPLIPEQADVGGADSTSGLGRVLFQRKPSPALTMFTIVAGALMIVAGLIAAGIEWNQGGGWWWLLAPGGAVIVFAGVGMKFSNFRCHERGVWQSNIGGQSLLRYTDIGSFTYSATRHYHNGAYTGTHLSMNFKPLTKEAGSAISYSTTVQGDDDDLDELRDFISQAIAVRMAGELAKGQPVVWTPNLHFTPQGFQYRPAGMFGRKDFELLPYDSYGGHSLDQGVFYLFAQGNTKAITSEQCSAENFFPGFFLLLRLMHAPAAEETASEPSSTQA